MYYVYMIRNADNKLNVGISVDPKKRLRIHNSKQGANFTKAFRNFKLVFKEAYAAMAEARHRENQIKKWRRDKKDFLTRKYVAGLPTKQ